MRLGLHCNACGKEVFQEEGDYFMLKDDVWAEVCKNGNRAKTEVLCRSCTEHYLGRNITAQDLSCDEINKNLQRKLNRRNIKIPGLYYVSSVMSWNIRTYTSCDFKVWRCTGISSNNKPISKTIALFHQEEDAKAFALLKNQEVQGE